MTNVYETCKTDYTKFNRIHDTQLIFAVFFDGNKQQYDVETVYPDKKGNLVHTVPDIHKESKAFSFYDLYLALSAGYVDNTFQTDLVDLIYNIEVEGITPEDETKVYTSRKDLHKQMFFAYKYYENNSESYLDNTRLLAKMKLILDRAN